MNLSRQVFVNLLADFDDDATLDRVNHVVKRRAPDNAVTLVTKAGERELAKASKDEIAAGIVDEVERLLEERRGGS